MAGLGLQRLFTLSSRSSTRLFAQTSAVGLRNVNANTTRRYGRVLAAATYSTVPPSSTTPSEAATGAANDTVSVLPDANAPDGTTDWSKSYSGLSVQPFSKEIATVLLAPIDPLDIEMKPGEKIMLICSTSISY